MRDKRDAVQSMTESVLIFIRQYHQEHGVMPSQREIAEGCYISKSNVIRHLDRLEMQGKISREPSLARNIRLLNESDQMDGQMSTK